MPYGTLKADTLTYYTATGDVNLAISGIAISGSPLISGVSGVFTTSVSGATVTGDAGQFTTITGGTAQFTNITGVSGTFTSRISGATVTGTSGQFTTITATTGVFTTSISGATISGDVGLFTTISGSQGVFNSGLSIPSGTAASPSISFNGDPNTGLYSTGADAVAISTNGTGRLFVDASGRVLTGTSSSRSQGQALQVEGIDFPTSSFLLTRNQANNVSSVFTFLKTRGTTTGSNTIVQAGDRLGRIEFQGADGTSGSIAAQIEAFADSTPGTGSVPGYLAFSTTASSASAPTERLRITSAGLVGVGVSSPQLPLTIGLGGGANPATSGSTQSSGGIARIGSSGAAALDIGTLAAGPVWLQSTNVTNLATNYSLLLNPNGGNVGIGTTSPPAGALLAVNGQPWVLSQNALLFMNADNTLGCYINGSGAAGVNPAMVFSTSYVERGRFDASGRFLVGTSSNIWGGGIESIRTTGTQFVGARFSADNFPSETEFLKSRGSTVGTNTIVQNNDIIANLNFRGADGSSYIPAVQISAQVDGTPGANDMPGRLVFSTTADGASSPTERMRIAQNGVITIQNGAVAVIGTLTDGATVTPDFAADCNFTLTISGNRTLANPTNITAGQSGSIFIIQGSGSNTLSWGSYWDFPGGTAPTLSTASGAVDRVDYVVRTSTSIHTVFTANYS